MFDIGFSELLVIGVVALVVIGPERLPGVARTVGHLYGRLQRYVSTVKSDISRELEMEELKRAGQQFKDSVAAVTSEVQAQSTVVDEFLKNEMAEVDRVVAAMDAKADAPAASAHPAPIHSAPIHSAPTDAYADADLDFRPQRALDLDEPDLHPATPAAVVETARPARAA